MMVAAVCGLKVYHGKLDAQSTGTLDDCLTRNAPQPDRALSSFWTKLS